MNAIKYFFSLVCLLTIIVSCKKDNFNDTSFVNSASAPAKLSVMFNIIQDNTGLVTIIPNGEGATSYDVYYGDVATAYVNVAAGKNIQHIYAEGVYNVKIVGHNIAGKTTEFTQPLTVSFRAPENLKVTATTNALSISISATATYQTLFNVYYGDSTNVTPLHFQSFLQGQTLTHVYPAAGVYIVKVVALSGGAATTQLLDTVKVGKQIDLPVNFDNTVYDYTFTDFGGNISSIASDPTNSANKVLKAIKTNGAQVYAGTTIGTALGFATPIPITFAATKMSVRVYSPIAGADIKLKIEDHTNSGHSVETDVLTTKANQWETLVFDFKSPANGTQALNTSYTYDKATIFFDFGNPGSGNIFYADDLMFLPAPVLSQINLPVTFDDPTVDYSVVDFGGAVTKDGVDPTHSANKIKITTKSSGAATYAGTTLTNTAGLGFSSSIPLTATTSQMSVRVYSPAAGIHVRLKVEDHKDNTKSVETEAVTTTANAWETLIFDFKFQATGTAAFNSTYTYDKATIFFDFNKPGDGRVYYWDDMKFVAVNIVPNVLALPLDFESSTLTYAFSDFGGGQCTVIANPHAGSINTSAHVAQMVKNVGQVYGGSSITLAHPIDFSTKKTITMKVFSPRVGANVLLKVENSTNGAISYQQAVNTVSANGWETLTFDFSKIDISQSYDKVTIIFDLGTMGDGSANFTYLFDDISLN
jgi:hypothetical protein